MEARLLITPEQIKMRAREEKIPAGVMEKDYALTWLLKGLYAEESKLRNVLVLKGGTAIRKVYFPENWRFSEDLDFTFIGNEGAHGIKEGLLQIFDLLLSESGVHYSLESFHVTEGSIIATVQFLGPLNFPNIVKHDITLREKMVLKPQWEAIVTKFPDLLGFDVSVYSLDEVLVEKIRSIMQRGYSRDYYDVWRLLREDRVDKTEIKRLLTEKCDLNGIAYRPDLIFDKNRLMEADAYWVKGLGYLVKDLPSFEAVVSDLRGMLDPLDL